VKILVAADMEGICGVVHWDHVAPSHPEHGRFRRLMSAEANAAALGALAGGADEVVVTDGHNDGCNILIEELDPRVQLHCGWLNGTEVGEIGLNGAVCAHFGVPVVAVCGCQAACAEATQLLGPVETAVVERRRPGRWPRPWS
jgi:D-amino peptidase